MGTRPKKRRRLPTEPFEDRPEGMTEQTRKALTEGLDWPGERLELFTRAVGAYKKRPIIKNYLKIRDEFPEVEIQAGYLGASLIDLLNHFADQGVDLQLITLVAPDEASMDALSLSLLRLKVARDSLPKTGPGFIDKRRNAISDSTINYLVDRI
jgi:hypothetical protein